MLANFSNLITFSRGSNATVTDASGRLTYAPTNLVTNSQDFESANWQKNAVTVTANAAVAPDSTATADQIAFSSTSAFIFYEFSTTTPNVTYIFSVWLRAAAATTVILSIQQSGGSVSNSTISLTTEWQRFFVSYTTSGSPTFIRPRIIPNSNTPTFLAWGAQLEAVTYQTTPSPYVSTSVANLLGFSEAFDNAAWTKENSAIVLGAAQNPINNLWNAQKLMENTATGNHRTYQGVSITNGIRYTYSVYAKAAERNRLLMTCSGGVVLDAVFDLSNGTVAVSTSGTASIQSVGNGWYRCAITDTATSTTSANMQIRLIQSGTVNSYTGDGNSGIYIYGAQLSNSGSLDPYVPTPGAAPSSTAYYGPRFDYDPVTLAAKGILIEEQRTNLTTYSGDPTNAVWAVAAAAKTSTNNADPFGTNTALLFTADGTNAAHYIQQGPSISFTSGTSYTQSIWVKAGTVDRIQLTFGSPAFGASQYANFYLSGAGSATASVGGTASITQYANGWYRIAFTATATATTSIQSIFVSVITSGTDGRVPSNTSAGTFLAAGAQLEAGAFATSYIPTVASQVTRSADLASITGSLFSQWYRQDEGTFVYAYQRLLGYTGGRIFASGVGGSNSYGIWVNTATGTQDALTVRDISGDAVSGVLFSVNTTAINKGAVTYKVNDFAWSTNGGTAATDTSGVVPSLSDQLRIGRAINTDGANLNGHIQNITYYPTRLTNDQLQAITK